MTYVNEIHIFYTGHISIFTHNTQKVSSNYKIAGHYAIEDISVAKSVLYTIAMFLIRYVHSLKCKIMTREEIACKNTK